MSFLTKVLRAGEGKKLKALQSLVPDINAFEPEIEADLRRERVEVDSDPQVRSRISEEAPGGTPRQR